MGLRYLPYDAVVKCCHGGTVTKNGPKGASLRVGKGKEPMLTAEDLEGASIPDCPLVGPGLVKCPNVGPILTGKARRVKVNGKTPLLQTFRALTYSSPPGFCIVTPSPRSPMRTAGGARVRAARKPPKSHQPAKGDKATLRFRLHDDRNLPVAGQWFQVTLANGAVIDGLTDAAGAGCVKALPAGECALELPNYPGQLSGARVPEGQDYRVKRADSFHRIADLYHFPHWQTIWEHPRNAELRAKRKTPEAIGFRDTLHLPSRKLMLTTGGEHRLEAVEARRELRLGYEYFDAQPVSKARYVVCRPGPGGEVLANGTLDEHGEALVEQLPADAEFVCFYFEHDPPAFAPFNYLEPQPHGFAPFELWNLDQALRNGMKIRLDGWWAGTSENDTLDQAWVGFQAAVDGVAQRSKAVFNWLIGALEGDFNEHLSVGQIVFNAAIGIIPVVGTVTGIRDIVANLKLLIWDRRYDELGPWLGLLFSVVATIPYAGSVVAGIFRGAARKLGLYALFEIINAYGRGNAAKFLEKVLSELPEYARQAQAVIRELLLKIVESLRLAAQHALGAGKEKFLRLIGVIEEEILPRLAAKLNAAILAIQLGLKKALEEKEGRTLKTARTSLGGGVPGAGGKKMIRQKANRSEITQAAIKLTRKYRRQFRREMTRILRENKDHPLRFLYDEATDSLVTHFSVETGSGVVMRPVGLEENVFRVQVDAGHVVSAAAIRNGFPADERFFLEDSWVNQNIGRIAESRGETPVRTGYMIEGVFVEKETLRDWKLYNFGGKLNSKEHFAYVSWGWKPPGSPPAPKEIAKFSPMTPEELEATKVRLYDIAPPAIH